eukprot:1116069-Pleurochrysis_carterae.AAC.1
MRAQLALTLAARPLGARRQSLVAVRWPCRGAEGVGGGGGGAPAGAWGGYGPRVAPSFRRLARPEEQLLGVGARGRLLLEALLELAVLTALRHARGGGGGGGGGGGDGGGGSIGSSVGR